jgi:hypothetical protein
MLPVVLGTTVDCRKHFRLWAGQIPTYSTCPPVCVPRGSSVQVSKGPPNMSEKEDTSRALSSLLTVGELRDLVSLLTGLNVYRPWLAVPDPREGGGCGSFLIQRVNHRLGALFLLEHHAMGLVPRWGGWASDQLCSLLLELFAGLCQNPSLSLSTSCSHLPPKLWGKMC